MALVINGVTVVAPKTFQVNLVDLDRLLPDTATLRLLDMSKAWIKDSLVVKSKG